MNRPSSLEALECARSSAGDTLYIIHLTAGVPIVLSVIFNLFVGVSSKADNSRVFRSCFP